MLMEGTTKKAVSRKAVVMEMKATMEEIVKM